VTHVDEEMLRDEEWLVSITRNYGPRDGAHDLNHSRRVWKMAKRLATIHCSLPDYLALFIAAHAHDLVPAQGPQSDIAAVIDSNLLKDISDVVCAPVSVRLAAIIIHEHSYSRRMQPSTPESACFQDADRLDALGAIGIARAFYVAGVRRSGLLNPDDPLCKRRLADDKHYAVDHFYQKLLTLPGKMHTQTARNIANQRAEFMTAFLGVLEQDTR
jgi:uncharacterized protein